MSGDARGRIGLLAGAWMTCGCSDAPEPGLDSGPPPDAALEAALDAAATDAGVDGGDEPPGWESVTVLL